MFQKKLFFWEETMSFENMITQKELQYKVRIVLDYLFLKIKLNQKLIISIKKACSRNKKRERAMTI